MLDLRAGACSLQERRVQTLDPLTTSLSSKVRLYFVYSAAQYGLLPNQNGLFILIFGVFFLNSIQTNKGIS